MVRKLLFAIALGMLVLVLTNCRPGGEPEPDPQTVQLERLSATWKTKNVTLDAVAQVGYENFTLTFSGTLGASSFGYTTGGRPTLSPWRSSGNWTFGSDVETAILRDPGTALEVPVTYALSNDGTQLELTFLYALDGEGGRVQDVKGAWVFTLTKQ